MGVLWSTCSSRCLPTYICFFVNYVYKSFSIIYKQFYICYRVILGVLSSSRATMVATSWAASSAGASGVRSRTCRECARESPSSPSGSWTKWRKTGKMASRLLCARCLMIFYKKERFLIKVKRLALMCKEEWTIYCRKALAGTSLQSWSKMWTDLSRGTLVEGNCGQSYRQSTYDRNLRLYNGKF